MTKHTPGPWVVEKNTTLIWGACDSDDKSTHGMGFPIAEARLTTPGWAKRSFADCEPEANAHLIAAAPELLEALKKAETLLNHMGDILNGLDAVTAEDAAMAAPIFEAVRAAIIKAEGTEK